jgi:AhpD family alkylhydroperoxidase
VMMLQEVEWEACLLEPRRDRAFERDVRRESGIAPPMLAYFASCPWVARSIAAFNEYGMGLVELDFGLADLIGLVVAQDNSCRYCYATQRALLRAQGHPERRIRQIEGDLLAAQLDPRGRAALDFAHRISRCSPSPTAIDRAHLRELGWTQAGIRELALVAAVNVYLNRVATIPALPVQRIERLAQHWILGVASPVLRRLLRARQRRGGEALSPEECQGPYAPLFERLGSTPAARPLRRMLDDAWTSTLLPRRAKGLAFAVVARGLGCALAEREAVRLLAADGTSGDEVERALSHLGASEGDTIEAAIVRFARETIRYRPAQLQRRARDLASRLDVPSFVELIGISSLANAVSRLWIALEAQ